MSWPSGHEVRLAFPPGRRRRGSGRVVSILHPHGNRRNPGCPNPGKITFFEVWKHTADGPELVAVERDKKQAEMIARQKGREGSGKYTVSTFKNHPLVPSLTKEGKPGGRGGWRKNLENGAGKAIEAYKQFHGHDPKEIITTQVSAEQRKDYSVVGPLEDIEIEAVNGRAKRLSYHSDKILVASSPNGKQLYFIGGQQQLSDDLLSEFGADPSKDLLVLGLAAYFTYWDRKKESQWKLVPWRHKLGEETGDRPVVLYDKLQNRVFFAGGAYYIKGTWVMN